MLFHAAIVSCLALVAMANPTPQVEDTEVFIRGVDFSYQPSEAMTQAVKKRDLDLPLHKRGTARVQACFTTACTECRVIYDGGSDSNTGCIPATNTACLIISNLSDAKVVFWNRGACNGNMSTFKGCGASTNVNAPGTNSIGVHTGC